MYKRQPFDEVRAPIVKEIFEKYTTGEWSMSDLAKWANEQGLKNFPTRRKRTKEEMLAEEPVVIEPREKPIDLNNIQYILESRFYTGMMMNSKKEWIPSKSHKPLISDELFQKVLEMRKGKKVSIRYREKMGHSLRGLIRCPECERLYTPYTKKGIQYYASRCRDDCTNTKSSFNLDFIDEAVSEIVSGLHLTQQELDQLDEQSHTEIQQMRDKVDNERTQNERKRRKIREDLEYLRNNRLVLLKSGVYTPEMYLEEEQKLNQGLEGLQEEEIISDKELAETIKQTVLLSQLLKNLETIYEASDIDEKEEIMRTLFVELYVSEKGVDFQPKTEFRVFKNREIVSSAPGRNRTYSAASAKPCFIH